MSSAPQEEHLICHGDEEEKPTFHLAPLAFIV